MQLQQLRSDQGFDPLLFHGTGSGDTWQGYKLTLCDCGYILLTSDDFNDVLGQAPFNADTNWHTYRVEVQGTKMKLIVDGKTLFTCTDSRFIAGTQVGIKSSTTIAVKSFVITSL